MNNSRTAMIYSTVDGHTLKICNRLLDILLKNKQPIELFSIEEFQEDISRFDRLILGASIRYGVHNKQVIDFITANKEKLDKIQTAFFSVNLVARKPDKNTAETNPYVIKFFKKIDWKPDVVEVFAGMLDYQKYPFWDRIMIQLIMRITKGPTDPKTKVEYTDWDQVDAFGRKLCEW
ncbi:MAG: menaquinone-dependent protoporphyrinogen IX dehydrogenase [Eudoraea sp.]|nr:menaquinone-dependent protoporphyrinogen IX dehydrogenase [Eudoraea sp.]NNJ40245.1 menaquinone-dependent protoporphyrinogen IX dehydrogenase [Eudoraea sp.]